MAKVDRPLGSRHPEHNDVRYPVNYGFVPGALGHDGEELDAYVLGVSEPVKTFIGRCIAIIHRTADYEVKLTAEHETLRNTIRDFAEKKIRPIAAQIDHNNKIPPDLITQIAKLGLSAITYKEEYGGLNADLLSMVIALEEL